MKSTIKKALLVGTSVLAAVTLLSGCSGGSSAASGSKSADKPAKMTSITVAVNPSAQMGPEYYGVDHGIFKKYNLDVTLVPQTVIATIVSGLASQKLDFGFATTVAAINANANNIHLVAVASPDGAQNPNEANEAGSSLMAGPGSGITSAGQLAGKTVAIVGTASLNSLAVYKLAADEGVSDPLKQIKLVQMPFGQMPQALASHQVDAAEVQAPFIAQAEASGSKVIAKPNNKVFPNMTVAEFYTTQNYINQHPDVVKAFSDAVVASQMAARKDIKGTQASIAKQLNLTPQAAAQSVWNTVASPYTDTQGMSETQDLMVKYMGLTKKQDISKLVWPGGEAPKK